MHTNVIAATSQSLPSHKQHHHCHSPQCLQGCVLLEHVCNGHACTVPQLVATETALRQKRDVKVDAASAAKMYWPKECNNQSNSLDQRMTCMQT